MYSFDAEIFNISSVQIRELAPVAATTPIQDATMGPFPTFGLAVITITDEDGHIGEAPVFRSYNHILENCLLPILLHSQDVPYGVLYPQLYWAIRNEGFRGPAAAMLGQVELALYDLAARRAGVPLHRYLNTTNNSVKVYGSGGGTNYSLEELEREASYFAAAGADCYKMKVGMDFGTRMAEDVARVKFVRRILGNNIRLAVDANQIWTCEEALRFIDLTAGENLAWFEEPVHSADLQQIGELCKRTPLAISYGESERSGKVFPTLVELGVRHLQPVPTHLAAIQEWMNVRDLATRHQLEFSSGGYSLFTAGLMASAGAQCQVEYLYCIMRGLEVYFNVRPDWKNGRFYLPEIPGMPVRIDWDYCDQHKAITKNNLWTKKNIRKYQAIVSL